MSLEDNKAIARRFLEVWGQGGLEIVDELAAPTLTVSYSSLEEPLVGPLAFKQALTAFHAQMGDLALVSEDDIIAEGDKVVIRWTARGTYIQDVEGVVGVSLIGQQVVWTGITIFHIVDGKVVEEISEEDLSDHWRQLGLVPTWTPKG
jgi:steroid delta-isomerase-like uncharacterized protein